MIICKYTNSSPPSFLSLDHRAPPLPPQRQRTRPPPWPKLSSRAAASGQRRGVRGGGLGWRWCGPAVGSGPGGCLGRCRRLNLRVPPAGGNYCSCGRGTAASWTWSSGPRLRLQRAVCNIMTGGGAGRPKRPTAMGTGRRSASKTRCCHRRAGGGGESTSCCLCRRSCQKGLSPAVSASPALSRPAPPRTLAPPRWSARRGGPALAGAEGGWVGRETVGAGGWGGSSHGLFPLPAALPCPLGPLPPRPSLPAAGPVQRRFRGRRRQHLRYAARREGRRHRRRRQTATPPADFPRSLARAPTGPRALAPSCLRRARPSGGRGRRGGGMGGA